MKSSTLVVFCALLVLFANAYDRRHITKRMKRAQKLAEQYDLSEFTHNNAQATYETGYFDVNIDHFDYSTTSPHSDTFKMRYLYNSNSWSGAASKGPIFFYAGNEGSIDAFWENSGFVTDYLPKIFGAYVLFAEHRYFGESMPFGNNSYEVPNLKYLTTEQAMADYVVFLKYYKSEVLGCPDCAVIAFGGSYGGMLAGWLRMKFPNVIDGAIAASAPILLFEDVVPHDLFFQIVTWDFGNSTAAPNCANVIRKGFDILQSYINDASGNQYEHLNQVFNICKPLTSNAEITYLNDWLSDGYVSLAMVDYPYSANFLGPLPPNPVNFSCQAFIDMNSDDDSDDIIEALYKSSNVYYNYLNTSQCNDVTGGDSDNDDEYDIFFENKLGGALDGDGWGVLACNEMCLTEGTNGTNDMFPPQPWNYTANTEYCASTFNQQTRYDWALDFFGGWNYQVEFAGYSNIVFSNGILDPWHAGGVLQNVTAAKDLTAYIMPSAHHLDLRSPNIHDPLQVQIVRALEGDKIRGWIKEKNERIEKREQMKMERASEL